MSGPVSNEGHVGRLSDRWSALSVVVLAFLVRSLPLATVFHSGTVVFAPADAMYHVRRSFYTFEHWPRVLLSDAYVNYPGGAPIPWSPLPDFLAGSLAALFASHEYGFATVLAWWPALIGGLGALPVYFVAREIANRGVALGAGGLYALLPVSVVYGRVGNPDHHVSAAAVGACLLLLCAKLASPGRDRRSLCWLAFLLALTRATLLFTWHGSLLYLAVLESTLLGIAVFAGRREVHAVHAASALGTLVLVGPVLATFPTPLLGLYSSIALSRLHMIAVAGAGMVALVGWWQASRARGPLAIGAQLGVLVAAALAFAAFVLALPGPRAGLEPAFRFLTMTDAAGAKTVEQFALFSSFGRTTPDTAAGTWGFYAYLFPLAPVFLLLWARHRATAPALVVAFWAALFGALALGQLRYGNDVAAAACVGLAIGGAQLSAALHERLKLPPVLAGIAVVVLGIALYAQPIKSLYVPWAARTIFTLTAAPGETPPPLRTAAWSLHQFLVAVRAVTPETSGYTDPGELPEYGIVAEASLGHALQWVARRPTPTDPFWEYIGPENWDRAVGLLVAPNEAAAVRFATELQARYVVAGPGGPQGRLLDRLYRYDGLRSPEHFALRRFRLVTEGPRGGRPIQTSLGAGGVPVRLEGEVPYKLFEIVKGARLEIPAASGSRVEASLTVRTPTGREFLFQTAVRTPDGGVARLRVPYANTPPGAQRGAFEVVTGPVWQITIDGRDAGEVFVPEAAVLDGATVRFE